MVQCIKSFMRPIQIQKLNLNKWSFLLTFLHEIAHRIVKEEYKIKVSPHGKEWKSEFRKILIPLITSGNLPLELEKALSNYCRKNLMFGNFLSRTVFIIWLTRNKQIQYSQFVFVFRFGCFSLCTKVIRMS